jgi:ankyrin repeat protein
MLAAAGGHSDAVDELLRAGARPNIRNRRDHDWTALMYAAKGSTSRVIDALASAGAHVSIEDANGDQPVHIAARASQRALVTSLLEHGAYVNQRGGTDHRTPLEIAVDHDDRDMAGTLLEHHACVTAAASEQAARKKNEKMIQLLDGYAHNECNRP